MSETLTGPTEGQLLPQVAQTVQGQACWICGAPATQWLLFKSQYKQSTVDLCDKHFAGCRQVFEAYILEKLRLQIGDRVID